jgi:hypothetical protein
MCFMVVAFLPAIGGLWTLFHCDSMESYDDYYSHEFSFNILVALFFCVTYLREQNGRRFRNKTGSWIGCLMWLLHMSCLSQATHM